MGLWERFVRLLGAAPEQHEPKEHDFTFTFPGHSILHVKVLDDEAQAFLMGLGSGISVDDVVVVRPPKSPTVHARYRIERITMANNVWRAYGRLEQQAKRGVRSIHGKDRTQGEAQRPALRRTVT